MNQQEQMRVAQTKQSYPPGTRIVLIEMDDYLAPVPAGTRGTVELVDDAGQVHMKWDNGRTLALIPGVDQFRRLTEQEVAAEKKLEIAAVTTEELRQMHDREGLILQGCGGNLSEWVTGINEMLTEQKILLDGTKFKQVKSFKHNGLTNLYFPFTEDVHIDTGKLAMWRLTTYEQFGGTWLSDYVPNQLGGFAEVQPVQDKPDCPLIGQDGNIFNLIGIASRTLREHGLDEQVQEMQERIYQSGSYHSALNILGEYVNITSIDEMEDMGMGEMI